MVSISKFIEKKLKLKINQEKSKVALASAVKFLGMTIVCGMITISSASMTRANEKLQELIPRGSHISLSATMDKFNSWYSFPKQIFPG
jgi:RNA-directed DNA polymerase